MPQKAKINLADSNKKESIIEKYLKKYRYLMSIQELFYIFAERRLKDDV